MRSTFAGLNTMFLGVNTNQLSLHTVGHNITNANTEGYSRQSVNQAAIRAQMETSLYGDVQVGRGVDAQSITRARDIYADKQYWEGNSTYEYYQARQKQYDKLEALLNDITQEGIKDSLKDFKNALLTLSTNSSADDPRIAVINQGRNFANKLGSVTSELQEQINSNYDDIRINVGKVNQMLEQMVNLNKGIANVEVTGAMANDLRDQRDLLVDNISKYVNINVYEKENGMYTLVSNGTSLVNGIDKLTLEMSSPNANSKYGVNDYTITIKEANGITYMPNDGIIRAEYDAIAEQKNYIDRMATIAAFLLSTFNAQHQQGVSGSEKGINFFGKDTTLYVWDSENSKILAYEYADSTTKHATANFRMNGGDKAINPDTGTYYVDVTVAREGNPESLEGVNIVQALEVNSKFFDENGLARVGGNGYGYVSPAGGGDDQTTPDGVADGSIYVYLANLISEPQSGTYLNEDVDYTIAGLATADSTRAIGTSSLDSYYDTMATGLGVDAETMDSNVIAQEEVIVQITEWRSSTSGVNWNEELTNMIMFQQGFNACSRCLTTMDEMLDRIINNMGMVGR